MGTENTDEQAFGIIKAHGVYQKNAAQHFLMLQRLPEVSICFENKQIECFKVDGAGHENPGFDEGQFYWTERHLEESRVCTLVTARHAGGSYLNRVELLNGCIALGHSGVFIRSTIMVMNHQETLIKKN